MFELNEYRGNPARSSRWASLLGLMKLVLALSVALLFINPCAAALASVEDSENFAWSPGADYELIEQSVPAKLSNLDKSSLLFAWKSSEKDTTITLIMFDYDAPYTAAMVANEVTQKLSNIRLDAAASVLFVEYGSSADTVFKYSADTVFKYDSGIVSRIWIQGSSLIILDVLTPTSETTLPLSESICTSISSYLKSNFNIEVYSLSVANNKTISQSLGSTLLGYLITVASIRGIRLKSGFFQSTSHLGTNYFDLSKDIRRAKNKARFRRFLKVVAWVWGLGITSRVYLAIIGMNTLSTVDFFVWVVITLVAILISKRLNRDNVERAAGIIRSNRVKGVVGSAIIGFANIVTIAVLIFAIFVTVMAGIFSSEMLDNMRSSDSIFRIILGSLLPLFRTWASQGFLLVGVFALLYQLYRLGHWLQAVSLKEAADRSNKHILYLRSFDEDKLKISSKLRRRGVITGLVASCKMRFEEIIVWQLSALAPVWAVADGKRFPAGASRIILADEPGQKEHYWLDEVKKYAFSSKAIVIGATPKEVRPGLNAELELIDEMWRFGALRDKYVFLIFGPWGTETFFRIRGFMDVAHRYEFFKPLAALHLPEGAQVAFCSEKTGWIAFGANKQSDWSYSICIDRALMMAEDESYQCGLRWFGFQPANYIAKKAIEKL